MHTPFKNVLNYIGALNLDVYITSKMSVIILSHSETILPSLEI